MGPMHSDPWQSLASPSDSTSITARRVGEAGKWDFYWGLDSGGHCLLVLRHDVASLPRERLPELKGIALLEEVPRDDDKPSLVFKLLDGSQRDIFHTLCMDIMSGAERARTEPEAVASAIVRTWRWHYLLRGGAGAKLSAELQKGLIGELLVLERYMLSALPPATALAAWKGPLGAAKDFTCGRVAIESKTRSSSTAATVIVSSEQQLDCTNLDDLFLHLSVLDPTPPEDDLGFTVTDVARRIRERVAVADAAAVDRLESLLAAAGFRFEDDYADARWSGGERAIYRVDGAFPRLTAALLPQSVSDVEYAVSLVACGDWLTRAAAIEGALGRGSHGS